MHKILLVDDATFMRVTLKNLFRKAGYKVVGEASNGKDAIKLYEDLKPDLTTMDITMPDMDGIEAIKKIMKISNNANILVVSAMGQKDIIIKAIEAGAKNFILKPFTKERVLETVEKMLRYE